MTQFFGLSMSASLGFAARVSGACEGWCIRASASVLLYVQAWLSAAEKPAREPAIAKHLLLLPNHCLLRMQGGLQISLTKNEHILD